MPLPRTRLVLSSALAAAFTLWAGPAAAYRTLADVEGKRCVLAYKTGLRVYRESFLQNAAYRLALAEEGIKTDGGYVILLPKTSDDESFQVVPVPPLSELVGPWQACLVLWRWQHAG